MQGNAHFVSNCTTCLFHGSCHIRTCVLPVRAVGFNPSALGKVLRETGRGGDNLDHR